MSAGSSAECAWSHRGRRHAEIPLRTSNHREATEPKVRGSNPLGRALRKALLFAGFSCLWKFDGMRTCPDMSRYVPNFLAWPLTRTAPLGCGAVWYWERGAGARGDRQTRLLRLGLDLQGLGGR